VQGVIDQVRKFIIAEIGWKGLPEELTDDLPLITSGVLDSLGVLTLVSFLERNYGIDVDDTDIVPDRLGSLAAVERYVRYKQDAARHTAHN
jgi:acyl carrier protein